jgi:ParB/RepB/Spo0J family partition protein
MEHRIPLAAIDVSVTNPRKHFDQAKLDELAESIKSHDVLQPILLRPKGDRYELVAGERRFRAARQAGLETIPAVVKDLTDKQALEVQVIENLQRADLNPLEEAEGYASLIRNHGYDADSLAAAIRKSRSYIYGRMKLADLCEPAKDALAEERISHSVALLIARIPDAKLQEKAAREVGPTHGNGPMPYRAAADYIQRTYMLKLSEAPFDRDSVTLVAGAGACSTCAFRTGNQTDLFPDVKSADVCTAPPCYEKKVEAHLKIEAKAKGWKSLSAAETKKVFPYSRDQIEYGAPYVDAEKASSYAPGAKTWAEIAPAATVHLARDPRGQVRKLIARADLPKKFQPRTSSGSDASPRQHDDTKWKRSQELRNALRTVETEAFLRGVTKAKLTVAKLWPLIVAALAVDRSYELPRVFERHGLGKMANNPECAVVLKQVNDLEEAAKLLVVADLLFGPASDNYRDPDDEAAVSGPFYALIGGAGLAEKDRITAELAAQWAAADEKKKAAKKKAAARLQAEPKKAAATKAKKNGSGPKKKAKAA